MNECMDAMRKYGVRPELHKNLFGKIDNLNPTKMEVAMQLGREHTIAERRKVSGRIALDLLLKGR